MNRNQYKKIRLGDINPYVRIINIHTIEKSFSTLLRYNRHYQFHYVFNGTAVFHIDGIDYTSSKGDLCLWAPGQAHSIFTTDVSSATVAGVQFDFTRNFFDLNYLLIPYSKSNFNENYINEIIEFTDIGGFPPYIRIKNRQFAEIILETAEKYFLYGGKYAEEKTSAKLKEFFIFLQDELLMKTSNKNKDINHIELLEYIRSHFHCDISNNKLAMEFGYHPVHLNRIIINLTGLSLHQYIIKLRMEEAIQLLQITNLSITEIAEKVGYSNSQYFSRLFKAKTGHPPTYFRK
jgi:AraC-like DNA-binding protein